MPLVYNSERRDKAWEEAEKYEEYIQSRIDNAEPRDQPFTKFDKFPKDPIPNNECKFCTKEFLSPQACRRHEEHCSKNSESELAWKCEKCGKGYKTKEGLAWHLGKHEEIQCYVCSDCSKVYQNLSDLRKHCFLFSHAFPTVEGPVLENEERCGICFKVYKKHSIENHMVEHQQKSNKIHECDRCNFKTNRKDNLTRHRETQHNIWNIDFDWIKKHFASANLCKHGYKCTKCNKICHSYEETVAHLKLKKCGEENICKICNIKFTMKQNLKAHNKRKHPVSK